MKVLIHLMEEASMASLLERYIKRCNELFAAKHRALFIGYGEQPYSTILLLNGKRQFLAYLTRAEHPNKTVYELWTQWQGATYEERFYSSHADSESKLAELTEKVVAELEEALPYPEGDYWGVVDKNHITVLFMLRQTLTGPGDRVLPPPNDYLVITEQATANNVWPRVVLASGWLDMQAFWQAIDRRELVPLKDKLQKSNVRQGVRCESPDTGALVIDGELLMHPEAWQRFPNSTPQDITKLVQRKFH